MNLVQAFEILNDHDVSGQRQALATKRIYAEVQEIGEKKRGQLGDELEDVISEVMLKFIERTPELTNRSEGGARGLINMALVNQFRDRCRKSNRRPDLVLDSDDDDHSSALKEEVEWTTAHDSAELREELQHSEVVEEPETPMELRRQLCEYLARVGIPQVVGRKHYQKAARRDLEQMRQLGEENCTWADLVNDEVGEEVTDKARKKARNTIQKRHSRTRKRLREWVEDETTELKEFDRRLLYQVLGQLRERRRSTSG